MIFNLPNPIPPTVTDPEELQAYYLKFGIIPYYGTEETTSHLFLDLLNTLAELSPTFKATMRDINTYTFGLNLEIVGRAVPGLKSQTTELSFNDQVDFSNYLAGLGIPLKTILKLSKRINYHLAIAGNAYLVITRVEAAGAVRYWLNVPHFSNCAYLKPRPEDAGEEFILISKFLTNKTLLDKHPPEVLRATQEEEELRWMTTAPGIEKAVVHIKKDSDGDKSEFYARPDILSVITYLYIDFQLGNLNSKIAATELVTKKILAFEAPDPNLPVTAPDDNGGGQYWGEITPRIAGDIAAKEPLSLFEQNMLVLKELTTNLGKHPSSISLGKAAATIAGVEYPAGANPPTPIDLELNRDTKHQAWQLETAVSIITAVLGWAPELIGIRPAAATLGGNLLYDIFTMKNVTTIKPKQTEFQDIWNTVLSQIVDREGGAGEFTNYGIEYPDVISEMVEAIKDSQTSRDPGQITQQRDQQADLTQDNSDGENDN